MLELLSALEEILDEANEVVVEGLPHQEQAASILALQRVRAKADALDLKLLAAYERSGAWAEAGFRSARTWLAHEGVGSAGSAASRLSQARRADAMPVALGAAAAGKLTLEHLRVLALARSEGREAVFPAHEPVLVELAARLPFAQWEQKVQQWCQLVDPAGADQRARRRAEGRRAHASASFDGMTFVDAVLDTIPGAVFRNELGRLEDIEFKKDWEAAKAIHGERVNVTLLARTPAQRRADCLVLMAERSSAMPAKVKDAVLALLVHVDADTFMLTVGSLVADGDLDVERGATLIDRVAEGRITAGELTPLTPDRFAVLLERRIGAGQSFGPRLCELQDGTPLLPSQLAPLLLRAEISRLVYSADGEVLDLGQSQRFHSQPQRLAILARDRTCTVEGCDVPGERCEIDHVVPASKGGRTSVANGELGCKPDNGSKRDGPARPSWRRPAPPDPPPELDGTLGARPRSGLDRPSGAGEPP